MLPHIGPGRYDVTLTIRGKIELSPRLDNVDLVSRPNPLFLNIDGPSPGPLVRIKGHLHFIDGKPRRTLLIIANASDRSHAMLTNVAPEGQEAFEVGPLPAGKYTLFFQSPEIETKQVDGVTAPTNDLEVDLQMSGGPITLRGSVAVPGAKGPQSLSEFRIRMIKTRELHGSTHDPNNNWERVYNSKGEFTAELPGPGIYVLEVTAEGFATVRSEPISTDHLPKDPLRLMLTRGASLVGTVVDEEGRPIDGAFVLSLAKAGGQLPLSLERNVDEDIGVRTVAGHFQFDGLSPGTDTFEALHADYAVTTARNVEIPAQAPGKLTIVMKRGGTVCGHVHDEHGRPARGVRLEFRRHAGHFAGERVQQPVRGGRHRHQWILRSAAFTGRAGAYCPRFARAARKAPTRSASGIEPCCRQAARRERSTSARARRSPASSSLTAYRGPRPACCFRTNLRLARILPRSRRPTQTEPSFSRACRAAGGIFIFLPSSGEGVAMIGSACGRWTSTRRPTISGGLIIALAP